MGIVVAVLLIVVLPLTASYNGMVSKQTAVDQSFADLDAQLQRRNDLIPQLVGAVKGALNHEETIFGQLTQARASYGSASTPAQKFDASNKIDTALKGLVVIVESNPQLQANANIRDLQTQLEGTENRIAQARRDYNGVVATYNISIRRFPRSIFAGIFGFHSKPFFQATPTSREVPKVDFGNTPSTIG